MCTNQIRILQIGAGSMGMRRMRDAVKRHEVSLAVYDQHRERGIAAAGSFDIPYFATLEQALAWKPNALVISTPPDQHASYVQLAMDRGLHHFCEANIWTDDWCQIELESEKHQLISAPSCSFHFHPLVTALKHAVSSELGTLHGFHYCLSTYMPDWHPQEGNEYYARQRNTSAGREMVPFELLWLNDIFGVPLAANGVVRQRSRLGDKLEDSWYLQIELEDGAVGHFSVFMGGPAALRQGWCIGEKGLIEFDVWRGTVRRRMNNQTDTIQSFGLLPDVIEAIYERETTAFLDALMGTTRWPMNYHTASIATATLAAAELSSLSECKKKVDPNHQPALLPMDQVLRSHQHHGLPHNRDPASIKSVLDRLKYSSR